ncbi:transmembrane protein 88 [Protopterus annectens]|uniref:transmembrane protein 88 n=1 Tax=Protopterus annectens TaxID=7888 RepID=UPI001CF98E42|nr:transmembrane protein 88 [Protopterus annectens]
MQCHISLRKKKKKHFAVLNIRKALSFSSFWNPLKTFLKQIDKVEWIFKPKGFILAAEMSDSLEKLSVTEGSVIRETTATQEPKGTVSVPPPYSAPDQDNQLELRSSLDCWACAVLISAQNFLIGIFNILIIGVIFGLILLPAIIMVVFGFLCHSKVLNAEAHYCVEMMNDKGSTALITVGFILLIPLMVLGLAAYCRVARRLELGLCFIPYSKAVYKNLPASHYNSLGFCCEHAGNAAAKVWV